MKPYFLLAALVALCACSSKKKSVPDAHATSTTSLSGDTAVMDDDAGLMDASVLNPQMVPDAGAPKPPPRAVPAKRNKKR